MKKHKEVATSAIDEHIGRRIVLRRQMLGMTQKALAEKCGITFQQMQKYEKAANRISASRLFQIGIALDSPAAFFYTGLPMQPVDKFMFQKTPNIDMNRLKQRVAEPTDGDPLARNDTLRLINRFWSLPDDKTRETVMNLIEALNSASPVSAKSDNP
ncbi:MAG: helix-turn-helix domain-containing protein [Alphaproteobacteria bacterium]|nr:helix-turn-helix domain-containing protein [Alphaproteobacteria bacterium]